MQVKEEALAKAVPPVQARLTLSKEDNESPIFNKPLY